MKTNNDNHQAVFLSFQPFTSVDIKNLGLGAETHLLCRGRMSWHV